MTLVGTVLRALRALRLVARPEPPPQATRAGPALPEGRDPDGLTPWQVTRCAWRLAALRPADRGPVQAALDAARPEVRPHLRRAIAAGRPASQVLALADSLLGRSVEWLTEHLTLVGDAVGEQRRLGVRVDQVDPTTCGTTVLLVLAVQADPATALALTDPPGGPAFPVGFDAAQRRVHRESTRFWPQALGTSPWGMAGWLRRRAPGAGRWQVRLVDDSSPADVDAVLARVQRALDDGATVPLLLGAGVPRHYVLALGRDGELWRVFEPTSGEVRPVQSAAIRNGRLGPLLGFDHLQAALLPAGP